MTRKTKKRAKPATAILKVADMVGDFAEDKDWAAAIREEAIRKELADGGNIILDFTGVTLTTQSFVHALISDILRSEGERILDKIEFRGCVPGVKGIVETVVQYSLETMEDANINDIGKKAK
jgi:STAS-like domain of unknown function (DUF4325)